MDHHFLQFFFNENRGFSSKLIIFQAVGCISGCLRVTFPLADSKCTKKVVFFLANITITYFFQILLR